MIETSRQVARSSPILGSCACLSCLDPGHEHGLDGAQQFPHAHRGRTPQEFRHLVRCEVPIIIFIDQLVQHLSYRRPQGCDSRAGATWSGAGSGRLAHVLIEEDAERRDILLELYHADPLMTVQLMEQLQAEPGSWIPSSHHTHGMLDTGVQGPVA